MPSDKENVNNQNNKTKEEKNSKNKRKASIRSEERRDEPQYASQFNSNTSLVLDELIKEEQRLQHLQEIGIKSVPSKNENQLSNDKIKTIRTDDTKRKSLDLGEILGKKQSETSQDVQKPSEPEQDSQKEATSSEDRPRFASVFSNVDDGILTDRNNTIFDIESPSVLIPIKESIRRASIEEKYDVSSSTKTPHFENIEHEKNNETTSDNSYHSAAYEDDLDSFTSLFESENWGSYKNISTKKVKIITKKRLQSPQSQPDINDDPKNLSTTTLLSDDIDNDFIVSTNEFESEYNSLGVESNETIGEQKESESMFSKTSKPKLSNRVAIDSISLEEKKAQQNQSTNTVETRDSATQCDCCTCNMIKTIVTCTDCSSIISISNKPTGEAHYTTCDKKRIEIIRV